MLIDVHGFCQEKFFEHNALTPKELSQEISTMIIPMSWKAEAF